MPDPGVPVVVFTAIFDVTKVIELSALVAIDVGATTVANVALAPMVLPKTVSVLPTAMVEKTERPPWIWTEEKKAACPTVLRVRPSVVAPPTLMAPVVETRPYARVDEEILSPHPAPGELIPRVETTAPPFRFRV